MDLVVVGVNHVTAPLAIRERLAVLPADLGDALGALRSRAAEALLLSTCNRVEVYAAGAGAAGGPDGVRAWLAARAALPVAQLAPHTYALDRREAVRHAFRVAVGLDSLIVGEDQIRGQWRRAIEAARSASTLGPLLTRLGDGALAAARRVQAATGFGRQGMSVVSAALARAKRLRGSSWAGAEIVLIGAGTTAARALHHLAAERPHRLAVVNRTASRALELAGARGVAAAPWEDLPTLLARADLVVTCTATPHFVIDADLLRTARRGRSTPLICIDLGVPRDIDGRVAELPGVALITVDELEREAALHRRNHQVDLTAAERALERHVEAFLEWWRGRTAATTIVGLGAHAAAIRDAELERTLARLPDLTAADRDRIRSLAHRLTARLLHRSTLALKRDPAGPLDLPAGRVPTTHRPQPHQELAAK